MEIVEKCNTRQISGNPNCDIKYPFRALLWILDAELIKSEILSQMPGTKEMEILSK